MSSGVRRTWFPVEEPPARVNHIHDRPHPPAPVGKARVRRAVVQQRLKPSAVRERAKVGAPHFLEEAVLRAFAQKDCHDGTSLGFVFAEAPVEGARRAYILVARDVLEYMESQGKKGIGKTCPRSPFQRPQQE